jgi:hypothetical protein
LGLATAPLPPTTAAQADQATPSDDVRASTPSDVPAGDDPMVCSDLNVLPAPASMVFEVYVPLAAYGVTRTQSAVSTAPLESKSETKPRRSPKGAVLIEATGAPSMKYATDEGVVRISYKCGVPMKDPEIGMKLSTPLTLVRANS